MTKAFKVGDRVAFAAHFLRDTQLHTGWAPFARGTVVSTVEDPLIAIRWDDRSGTTYANRANLVREDQISTEPV